MWLSDFCQCKLRAWETCRWTSRCGYRIRSGSSGSDRSNSELIGAKSCRHWYRFFLYFSCTVACSLLASTARLFSFNLSSYLTMAFSTWRYIQISVLSAALGLAYMLDAPTRNNMTTNRGLLNFVHLLSCCLWFGVQTWVTFVAGEVCSLVMHFCDVHGHRRYKYNMWFIESMDWSDALWRSLRVHDILCAFYFLFFFFFFILFLTTQCSDGYVCQCIQGLIA